MTVEGVIQFIGATEQPTQSFSKRRLIIQTQGNYPEMVMMEATQTNCAQLDQYQIGQFIRASINIRGSKEMRQDKNGQPVAYTSIQLWKLELVQAQSTPLPTSGFTQAAYQQNPANAPQQPYTPPQQQQYAPPVQQQPPVQQPAPQQGQPQQGNAAALPPGFQ